MGEDGTATSARLSPMPAMSPMGCSKRGRFVFDGTSGQRRANTETVFVPRSASGEKEKKANLTRSRQDLS